MIFAAGLGTRLKPITDSIPKALLPIGGKTLLEWQLEKLRNAGFRDVVINIHHFPEQIRAFCAELCTRADFASMRIQFSDESEMLLETGGGLKKAGELLTNMSSVKEDTSKEPKEAPYDGTNDDEPILVMNVDVLSNISLHEVIAAHQADSLATLVVSERKTQRYFVFDQQNQLVGWTNIASGECKPEGFVYDEKKEHRLLAFSGMHVVSPQIFEQMKEWPERFPIVDFYLQALKTQTIRSFVPKDYRMMDIGKIDHLDEAKAFAESLSE